MPDKPAGELEKRAREFLVKWDYDHAALSYRDVDMLTEFARATAQAIERMLRERAEELREADHVYTSSGLIKARELEKLADQIREEYGL